MIGGERGQAAVELAVLLPLLLAMLLMTFEGGLFLTEHLSVVNAAREGARYLVDGGADGDLAAMAANSSRRLVVTPSRYDVWAIRGHTSAAGAVTFDTVTHAYGIGPALPALTLGVVQARLAGSGAGVAANLRFVAVEVAYRHDSVTGVIALPAGFLTLRSYGLIGKF